MTEPSELENVDVGDTVFANYTIVAGPKNGTKHHLPATVEAKHSGRVFVVWNLSKQRAVLFDGCIYRVPSLELVGVGLSVTISEDN